MVHQRILFPVLVAVGLLIFTVSFFCMREPQEKHYKEEEIFSESNFPFFLEQLEFDLGNVVEGEIIEFEISFVNVSQKTVTGIRIDGSCVCLVTELSQNDLHPQAKGIAKLIIDTTGRKGTTGLVLRLTGSYGGKQYSVFPRIIFRTIPLNQVSFSQEILNFGTLHPGDDEMLYSTIRHYASEKPINVRIKRQPDWLNANISRTQQEKNEWLLEASTSITGFSGYQTDKIEFEFFSDEISTTVELSVFADIIGTFYATPSSIVDMATLSKEFIIEYHTTDNIQVSDISIVIDTHDDNYTLNHLIQKTEERGKFLIVFSPCFSDTALSSTAIRGAILIESIDVNQTTHKTRIPYLIFIP